MRKGIYIVFTLVFAFSSQAQTADGLIKQMFSPLENASFLKYDFELQTKYPESEASTQVGKWLQHSNKMKLYFDDMWILNDGEARYVYDAELEEIQIYNLNDGPQLPFTIDYIKNTLEQDLIYDITGTNTYEKQDVYEIEFKPKKEDRETVDYFKMRLAIYKGNKRPAYFALFQKDGTRYTLKFKDISTEVIADDHFIFNSSDYPNVSIEDLRL